MQIDEDFETVEKMSTWCWSSTAKSLNNLKKEIVMDEHLISIESFVDRLNTDVDKGLTTEQAVDLLHKNGLNVIKPISARNNFLILLENLFGLFNCLLWLGSILCIIVSFLEPDTGDSKGNNLFLGIVLAVVVFVTGYFSYYQQKKSDKIMDSFKNLVPKSAIVIRDGLKKKISADHLVVGDLVELKGGDQIPADVRIIKNEFLRVDNSTLTGESDPQSRSLIAENENPLEAKNLLFFSTNCIEGMGRGIVIRTGDRTVMGRIALLATGITQDETPLEKDLRHFIIQITFVALFCAIIFFIACALVGLSWLNCLIYFITIIVANVPEGLLPTMTVALSLTAKRMASKNCLVKSLRSVETLGSTSAICTDKTGTLTQNKMTASHLWYCNQLNSCDKLIDSNAILDYYSFWEPLIKVCAVCSRAIFVHGHEDELVNKRPALGDSSEVAILRFTEQATGSVNKLRDGHEKIFALPFNSTNKFSMAIIRNLKTEQITSIMKGASETIIKKCSTYLFNGKNIKIDQSFLDRFHAIYDTIGGYGERIIGFCDKQLDSFLTDHKIEFNDSQIPKDNYRFLGLISFIDPPRPAVPNAVEECRLAGIKVVMVTGDHPITAKAIAKMVNIISGQTRDEIAKSSERQTKDVDPSEAKAVVVTGIQLAKMTEHELFEILKFEEIVFARTSPQQKLIIVEGFQKLGFIVAVTGDGVNDSPALKKANIGISMGIAGSDVSKQAASMILLDDNFASIVVAIEEGRTIFDNLKKSICYTLSSKLPEMMPFLAFVIFDVPLALSAITILCIDLGTDLIPAISLAYEHPESDIMLRKPRNIYKDTLINPQLISVSYFQMGFIQVIAGFFSYLVVLASNGFLPSQLIGIRNEWEDEGLDDLVDGFGQEWTFPQRKLLEHYLYTTFFVSVITTKIFTLLACKTRKLSILDHGVKNQKINFAILIELCLAAFVVYMPKLNAGLQMFPISFFGWFYSLPIAILVLLYDEFRKYLIRTLPGSFFEKKIFY